MGARPGSNPKQLYICDQLCMLLAMDVLLYIRLY